MSSESSEPFAPSAPAGIPDAPLPLPMQRAQLSQAKFVAMLVIEVVYAIVCVVGLFVLNNQASLANRLLSGDTTVTTDQAHAADNNVRLVEGALIVAFILFLVTLALWSRDFRKVFGKERTRALENRFGFRIVGILWAVAWIIGSVAQGSGTSGDAQALVSADHRSMILLGIRAALLLVFVALTVAMVRYARKEVPQIAVEMPFAPLGY